MTLSLPKCESYRQFIDDTGIYLFKGVKCYGSPRRGPWVEIYDNGKIRKFEPLEIPVGGYSSVAAQLAKTSEPIPLNVTLLVYLIILQVIEESDITFASGSLSKENQ